MPGVRSTYNARTADFSAEYSDEHPWCRVTGYLPDGPCVAWHLTLRGGGGISQPKLWNREYRPEEELANKDLCDALLDAGVAFAEVEYPNLPTAAVENRHVPTLRLPHTWRKVIDAIAFLQDHGADGRISGSRSIVLPSDPRRFGVQGVSEGALIAAQVALAPRGLRGYDDTFRQSAGAERARRASGRIGAAILDDLPSDFRPYDAGISGSGIQHFGVSERWPTDPFNNSAIVASHPRWKGIPSEAKRDAGVLELIRADAMENRAVAFLVNCSGAQNEATYLNSGLTIQIQSAVTGQLDGSTEIHVQADPTKTATIRLIHTNTAGVTFIYAEPSSSTNLAHWTGTLETNTGATFGDSFGGYQATGADTRKTFLSRQQALKILLDTNDAGLASGVVGPNAYAPQVELVSPHPVDLAALFRWRRELCFPEGSGRRNPDTYRLGSRYPALLSGDTPHIGYSDPDPGYILNFYRGLGWPI